MKTKILFVLIALVTTLCSACKKSSSDDPPQPIKLEVFKSDVPFQTDKFLRIGYSIKTWEYDKEGLLLEQIVVLDYKTNAELMKIEKVDLPKIHKDPLPASPYFTWDKISSYYLSLQLPLPLNQAVPSTIFHRFIFQDTLQNKTVTIEGGIFSPRINETPISIASPVKGSHWAFINQSTLGYHFNTMFFMQGKIGTGEQYAFDNLRINDAGEIYSGDPTKNESYFNYKDTLYAVANGTVVLLQDELPENAGNSHNVTFTTANELGGNYLALDLGNGRYAYYCHCVPGSFMVKVGHSVQEGAPIALLGNSGNSDAPHLHFEIVDSQDLFMSRGIPFVLKKYTKTGELGTPWPPTVFTNAMMEETTIISFD